jgi:hypothetical protein
MGWNLGPEYWDQNMEHGPEYGTDRNMGPEHRNMGRNMGLGRNMGQADF